MSVFIFVLLLIFPFAQVIGQIYIYERLSDHDVRLTELEKRLVRLNHSLTGVQQENSYLRTENDDLRLQIKNLTSQLTSGTSFANTCQAVTSCIAKMAPPAVGAGPTTVKHTVSTTIQTPTRASSFSDCQDAYSHGARTSGVVNLTLPGISSVTPVYCDMDQDGGGWTVIQRRFDGSVNFNQNWNIYRTGFGNPDGEYWLGNDRIHALTQLTHPKSPTLRINMEDWDGRTAHAQYTNFRVESKSRKYTLTVGSYSGNAGDSLNYPQSYMLRHNGHPFSTPDADNDASFQNCARRLTGGWWFNSCYSSNLNGQYRHTPYGSRTLGEVYGDPTLEGTGIEWYPWKRKQYSLKKVEMKVKFI